MSEVKLDDRQMDIASQALAATLTRLVEKNGHTEGLEQEAINAASALIAGMKLIAESGSAQ